MNNEQPKVIVWFRRDLRLSDHPALAQAVNEKALIIPLFIFDPYLLHHPETGSGRVQFLLGCLDSLQKNLAYLGSTLIRRYGAQGEVLPHFAREVGATAVYWNQDSERRWRTGTDESVKQVLRSQGVTTRIFRSEALLDAGGQETYALKTFTPQWYQFLYQPLAARPKQLPHPHIDSPPLFTLKDLQLPPPIQSHRD